MIAQERSVRVIEIDGSAEQLLPLRGDWDRLYARDPHANVFQSWSWVRGLADTGPGQWVILTVRDASNGDLVALLPLGRRDVRYRGVLLERQLCIGGKFGDSTGMVCVPGFEEAATAALASYVRHGAPWDTFNAFDVADPRLRALVNRVAGETLEVQAGTQTAIPFIALPDDWERYLSEKLTSRRREDLRRAMRALEKLPGYRVTELSDANFDRHFDIIMRLRHERWGGSLEEQRRQFYPLMRSLVNDGMLWLRMFWDGSEPVAAIGGLPDAVRGVFWYYWGVFNADYAKISPGKGAFGVAIRHAIHSGFHTFSMTYGDEPYKATFGTDTEYCSDLIVKQPSLRCIAATATLTAAARMKRLLRRRRDGG